MAKEPLIDCGKEKAGNDKCLQRVRQGFWSVSFAARIPRYPGCVRCKCTEYSVILFENSVAGR